MAATDPYQPEIILTEKSRVACDGAGAIAPALGHPRVFLQIGADGYVDCGYCDRRYVLKGGPVDPEPSERAAPGPH